MAPPAGQPRSSARRPAGRVCCLQLLSVRVQAASRGRRGAARCRGPLLPPTPRAGQPRPLRPTDRGARRMFLVLRTCPRIHFCILLGTGLRVMVDTEKRPWLQLRCPRGGVGGLCSFGPRVRSGSRGGAGSPRLPSREPGTEWHWGGQCDGSTPPPHLLFHVSEVCYQLLPSTPGDTSLRGLGVPRVSRNSSSPPPKLPTRSRVEHQLPVLAAPSWPSSLLRAGRPTHRHPVCPLPGYVQVCRQHSGLHSQFRTRRVSLGWPRCFLPPRIAVRTE